jgi:hypothetical protein
MGSIGADGNVGSRALLFEGLANRNLRGVHILRHRAVAFRESQGHLAFALLLAGDDRRIGVHWAQAGNDELDD